MINDIFVERIGVLNDGGGDRGVEEGVGDQVELMLQTNPLLELSNILRAGFPCGECKGVC